MAYVNDDEWWSDLAFAWTGDGEDYSFLDGPQNVDDEDEAPSHSGFDSGE